jgi:Xaa-Pro aminopeptidase
MKKKLSQPQASLITDKSNIRYLSNFTGSAGFMLLTRGTKYLFTDFRYIERAKNTIKKGIKIIDITKLWKNEDELKEKWQKLLKKHGVRTLGIEESHLTIAKFKKFKKLSRKNRKSVIKFTNISGKIESLREKNTKQEISHIQKSQRINEKVFTEIKKIIQQSQSKKPCPGITEIDLVWKIKELAHKYGADDISFNPIVAFGPNTGIPHHSPTKRKLKHTDVVLIDMGMKYKGYCSDMTRTILPKSATKQQKEIYALVLKAQNHAIQNIKPGITGKKADAYARDIIKNAGYSENYGHSGGHGIGLDIHEQPSLADKYIKKLKESSIITVEPGIYLPGKFGVRIEDMILLTKTGNKNLTKMKK